MICPQCGTDNRPGARFCARCGAVLPSEEEAFGSMETVSWASFSPQASVSPPAPKPWTPSPPQADIPPVAPESWTPSDVGTPARAPVARRFPLLRIISTVYKVIGGIIAALTVLGTLGICILSIGAGGLAIGEVEKNLGLPVAFSSAVSGVVFGLINLLLGGIVALAFWAGGEFISLLLAIEENTRSASH